MDATAYWNPADVEAVPVVTGAASVMDCADLVNVCKGLGIRVPMPSVYDVGCGTGRWSKFCRDYYGVDISEQAVAYARRAQVDADIIRSPRDISILWSTRLSNRPVVVTCFSVFTHIPRSLRLEYLAQFRHVALTALVDIIPGDGSGDVRLWTADPLEFVGDCDMCGWVATRTLAVNSPDGPIHQYYRLEAR